MKYIEGIEEIEEIEVKKDSEKLDSTYHTLFKIKVKEVEKQYIPNTSNTPKNNKTKYYRKIPGYTRYRLFVDNFMEFEKGLHSIYNELWNAGPHDKLELRINSNGGLVNEGCQFYSIIKNKFNGRCTTILDNKGYSMGALTFCMGDKRIITERADLMFHDYSSEIFGKGGEIEARNKHMQAHVREFFKDVIFDKGFLTKKEFNNMVIGQDYWMDCKELCRRGIATHVLVNGKKVKAKKYLKIKTKNKKERK